MLSVQQCLGFHALLWQDRDIKGEQLRKGLEAVKGREKRLVFLPRSWRWKGRVVPVTNITLSHSPLTNAFADQSASFLTGEVWLRRETGDQEFVTWISLSYLSRQWDLLAGWETHKQPSVPQPVKCPLEGAESSGREVILIGSGNLLLAFANLPHLTILSKFVVGNNVTPTQSRLPFIP